MAFDLAFTDSIGDLFAPVSDTFTRTVANGWGTSDSGQAWTTSGGSAADYSVGSGKGSVSLGAVNVEHFTTTGSSLTDVDITAEVTVPVTAAGGSIYTGLMARITDTNNCYHCRLGHDTAGTIDLLLERRVGGTFTTLASSLNHMAYTPGTPTKVRLQIVGNLLRCRIWTGTEPSVWHLSVTDTTYTSGPVGTRNVLDAANTNTLPVVVTYDNFSVNPVAQVRLDLNDDTPWRTLADGTDFGTPPLKRAIASTLLQDGEQIPAAAYGNRTLTLTLDCQEPTFDAAATAFQALSRELDRPTNFLRYRPGTTAPVFFRTFRSDIQSVQWDPFLRRATVSIPAEPFAHGLREALPAVTIANDPATGCFFDANSVKGDVETPLVLAVTNSTPLTTGTLVSAVAVRRGGTPSNVPFILQAEAMTAGTDTSVQANSAEFSGAGSNYMRTTFATPTLTTRLSISRWPTNGSTDARDDYLVWLRCRKTINGDAINVRLGYGASDGVGSNVLLSKVAVGADMQWVLLGRVPIPAFADPVYDASGMLLPARGVSLQLEAERTSGTGSLDWDCVAFMPAGDRSAIIRWASPGIGVADYQVVDAVNGMLWLQKSGEVLSSNSSDNTHDGLLPYVTPGVDNRIFWLLNAGDNQPDVITHSTTLAASYNPRYLHVRPATT